MVHWHSLLFVAVSWPFSRCLFGTNKIWAIFVFNFFGSSLTLSCLESSWSTTDCLGDQVNGPFVWLFLDAHWDPIEIRMLCRPWIRSLNIWFCFAGKVGLKRFKLKYNGCNQPPKMPLDQKVIYHVNALLGMALSWDVLQSFSMLNPLSRSNSLLVADKEPTFNFGTQKKNGSKASLVLLTNADLFACERAFDWRVCRRERERERHTRYSDG